MGIWGARPWDSDAAADWFGDLLSESGLAEQVERTLNLDIEDDFEEVRAAAAVLVLLGHNYVWPVEDLDRHLELAASRLEEIIDRDLYEGDEELVASVRGEIDLLRSRVGGGSAESSNDVRWWCF
jgi:hypothetical protein